ncbi:hypothetical protein G4B88_019265 [Cannabis sativa]|uniref:Reverse transcriptase zinc-binding domain-containing protein n=1 Tax=Cannabis sativa TaxID=3483 RepID=A0A7J6HN81_CANSA|nr:hypothetical protein G4B88_019265 [Cannabis sativa]
MENTQLEMDIRWLLKQETEGRILYEGIPLKVKNFIWKLSHDWLPSRKLLQKCKIHVGKNYRCGVDENLKNLYYAIWGCRESKKIWKEVGLEEFITREREEDAMGFLMRVAEKVEKEKFDFLMTLTWQA